MSQVDIVNTDTAPLKKAVGAKRQGESIFELSRQGRRAMAQRVDDTQSECLADIPEALLRVSAPGLPEVSELQAVRHFTNLSRQNYAIDTMFIVTRLEFSRYSKWVSNALILLKCLECHSIF